MPNRVGLILAILAMLVAGTYLGFYVASSHGRRSGLLRSNTSPVTPLPTLTPTATPQTTLLIFDTTTQQLTPLAGGSGYGASFPLVHDTILVNDWSNKVWKVVRRDGTLVVVLVPIVNTYPVQVSGDGQYVLWADRGVLWMYDAAAERIAAATAAALRDLPDAERLKDGGILISDFDGGLDVVRGANAAVVARLPVPRSSSGVSPSPDGRQFAWVDDTGLNVWDPMLGTGRLFSDVHWVVGDLRWSPDGQEIAFARLSGDSVVHVEVLRLRDAARREVYAGAPHDLIYLRPWATAHRVEFSVTAQGTSVAWPTTEAVGTVYTVSDDGAGLTTVPTPRSLWGFCGAACGPPPAWYAVSQGITQWCALTADRSCDIRLAYVDRQHGTARDIPAGQDPVSYAVSPDGTQLAMVVLDSRNDQHLTVIDLRTFSARSFSLPHAYGYSVRWFPDGRSLVLFFGGV